MKTTMASFFFVLLLNYSNAQSIKSFMFSADSLMEAGSCKILHSGYIVTGKYYSGTSYVNYAIRYNNDGSVKWTRQESAGNISVIVDVAEDEKGDLFFLAEDVSGYGHYSLIKTDSLGTFAWSFDLDKAAYASYGNPRLLCNMSGHIYVLSSTYEKTHVFKMSTNTGSLSWSRTFDIDFITEKNPGFDLVLTGDGGIICTGKADADIFMVCISPAGNLVWTKRMNDFNNTYSHAKTITRLHDGNYLIAGYRGENNFPFLSGMFLIKIDSLGAILNYNFYYDSTNTISFIPERIHELADHTIRVLGNGGPFTVAEFDASLNLTLYAYWSHITNIQTTSNCFDMKNDELLITCGDRIDQQYVLRSMNNVSFCQMINVNSMVFSSLPVNEGVYTNSINFNPGPMATTSTNPLFAVMPYFHSFYCGVNESILSSEEINEPIDFAVYPNPVQNTGFLTFNVSTDDNYQFALYNSAGELALTYKYAGIKSALSMKGIAPGVYFLRVVNSSGSFNGSTKIVVN
jgi:Secretion system C-terminal sorting domain